MVKQKSIKVKDDTFIRKTVRLVFNPSEVDEVRKSSNGDIPRGDILKLNNKLGFTDFFDGEEEINPVEEYDFRAKGHRKTIIVCGQYLKII